jgi:bifunctional DNA-binding transcriptional regulator/antitoxin component of YhaV-PrlF toxin-antitoxin module
MAVQRSTFEVSHEHQFVIPRHMLEEAGIRPGDQLYVSCAGGCISLTRLSDFEGSGETASRPLSDDNSFCTLPRRY